MNIKELKRKWLLRYIYNQFFYLPVKKEESGYGNIYIRQIVYTSYDIALGAELKEKGTINQYCAQWVLLNNKNEVVYNDKKARYHYYYYRQNALPAGTYIFKILATPFKPVNGYEQQIKIKPNETTNFDVLFTFMAASVKYDRLDYDPYKAKGKYYYYGSGKPLPNVTWGGFIEYGAKRTISINNEIIEERYIMQAGNKLINYAGYYVQGNTIYAHGPQDTYIICDGGGAFPTSFSWNYAVDTIRTATGSTNLSMTDFKYGTHIWTCDYNLTGQGSLSNDDYPYEFEGTGQLTISANHDGDDGIYWFSLSQTEWWDLSDSSNTTAWIYDGNGYFTESRMNDPSFGFEVGNSGSWQFDWTPTGIVRSVPSPEYLKEQTKRLSGALKKISKEKSNFYVSELHRIAPIALKYHKAAESDYYKFKAVPYRTIPAINTYAYFYENGEPLYYGSKTTEFLYKGDPNIEQYYYAYSYTYFSDDYEKY